MTIVEGSTGSGDGTVRLFILPNFGDKRDTSSRLPTSRSGSNRRAHDGSRLPSYNLRGTIADRGISFMRRREGQCVAARVAAI